MGGQRPCHSSPPFVAASLGAIATAAILAAVLALHAVIVDATGSPTGDVDSTSFFVGLTTISLAVGLFAAAFGARLSWWFAVNHRGHAGLATAGLLCSLETADFTCR